MSEREQQVDKKTGLGVYVRERATNGQKKGQTRKLVIQKDSREGRLQIGGMWNVDIETRKQMTG